MAQPFFSPGPARNFTFEATLEQLWFRRRVFHVPNLNKCINYYNVFWSKQFDQNEHFRLFNLVQLQLRSASESTVADRNKTEKQNSKQNHKTAKQNQKTQNRITKLKTESQNPKQKRKTQNGITKLKTESQKSKQKHKTENRNTK